MGSDIERRLEYPPPDRRETDPQLMERSLPLPTPGCDTGPHRRSVGHGCFRWPGFASRLEDITHPELSGHSGGTDYRAEQIEAFESEVRTRVLFPCREVVLGDDRVVNLEFTHSVDIVDIRCEPEWHSVDPNATVADPTALVNSLVTGV